MLLNFRTPHLSITQFDPIEISDFAVLTGVNGSGKSHLLDAIEKRHVSIEGMDAANIVLFNYETFRLENESEFNGHQIAAERDGAWQYLQQQVLGNARSWRYGLGPAYDQLKSMCNESKINFLSLPNEYINDYRVNFTKFFNNPQTKQNPEAQAIRSLAYQIPYSIDEITYEEFLRLYKPFKLKNDFLPHQIGKVFWDYYVKHLENEMNDFQNNKSGKNYATLSTQDFIKIHGEKPWEIINEILGKFETLKYRVNSPEGANYFGNYKLRLQHTEKPELEVEFSTLSSGEKILMALVASVYKSASDRSFPDILLLDEVDASLHPSMIKNMLEVICDVFVRQGIKVLLVTHSPTTIAIAPEDSIYVVNQSGRNRIQKRSKAEALSILTQGFATLEHGLKLFDEVAKSSITIITEGNNVKLIIEALKHFKVNDVHVLNGIQGSSGKNQLKTLFDFFSKTQHKSKVLIVWDCDVTLNLSAAGNTYPFTLPTNQENQIAKTGIENMFPASLFENFLKTITLSRGNLITEFDSARKRDFEEFVIRRNNPQDFLFFENLVSELHRISNLPLE